MFFKKIININPIVNRNNDKFHYGMDKGFTLLEVIIVTLIILIVGSIIVGAFSRFNRQVSLQSNVSMIQSLLHKAQSDTISSRGGLSYGVHFESAKVVLFHGDMYSSGALTNQIYPLDKNISISVISLTGGSNVIFERLIGTTINVGSVTVSSVGADASQSVISISGNGIVTIQ